MDEMYTELTLLNKNTSDKFEQNLLNLRDELVERHCQLENNFDKRLTEQDKVVKETLSSTDHDLKSKLHATLEIIEEKTNNLTIQHNTEIQTLKENIEKQNEKVLEMKQQLLTAPTTRSPEIYVTCNSGTNYSLESNIPKFNGRNVNPQQFLQKLKRYYERTKERNTTKPEHLLHDIIESSLEHHASRWFEIHKGDINSWSDFEHQFDLKYWNKEVQKGIRHRLEIEKYRPNGKLNRAEYFVERVLTLKSMHPTPSEDEIISILSDHYSDIIKDACRVQNIRTIQDMEALLQREDLEQTNSRSKSEYRLTFSSGPPRPRSPPVGKWTPQQHPNQSNQYYRTSNHPPDNNRNHYQQGRPTERMRGDPRYEPYQRKSDRPYPEKRDYPAPRNPTQPKYQPNYPSREQVDVCQMIMERQDIHNLPPNDKTRGDKRDMKKEN